MSAQLWLPDDAIAATPLDSPGTSTAASVSLQHLTPPAAVSAHSVVIALTSEPSPATAVGVKRPRPQHTTRGPAAIAHVRRSIDDAIAVTPLESPETSAGVVCPVDVPSPSWPRRLSPQHFAAPELVTAQASSEPAEIALTPVPRPATSTGVRCRVVVPSPSA